MRLTSISTNGVLAGVVSFVIGLAIVAMPTVVAGAMPQFSTSLIDLGVESWGVAVDDFNHDGKLDFVIRGVDRNLYLFLNTGDNHFTRSQIGSDPGSLDAGDMTSGDFNGDHWPDFAYTDYSSQVRIYLNNRDGTFSSTPFTAAEDFLTGIDCGDMNGDGKYDLVVNRHNSPRDVLVYLGDGIGGFVLQTIVSIDGFLPANAQLIMLTVGDFNHDGATDFITGQDDDGDPGASWLFLGGSGGGYPFAGKAYDTNPGDSTSWDAPGAGHGDAYDFDGDGNLDVLTPRFYNVDQPGELVYFSGNGTGAFGTYLSVTMGFTTPDLQDCSAPPFDWPNPFGISVATSPFSTQGVLLQRDVPVCFDRGADVNCDGIAGDVFDVIAAIDIAFSGGTVIPCASKP